MEIDLGTVPHTTIFENLFQISFVLATEKNYPLNPTFLLPRPASGPVHY